MKAKASREEIAEAFRSNRGSMKTQRLSLEPPVSSAMISNWMSGYSHSARVEEAALAMYRKLKRRAA